MATKRRQWLPEGMERACKAVKEDSTGLRQAARAYNVPVKTLRRRVAGIVDIDCRPGPPTVLTKEEESRLAEYCQCHYGRYGLWVDQRSRNGDGIRYCRENRTRTPLREWSCWKRVVHVTASYSHSMGTTVVIVCPSSLCKQGHD